MRITIDFIPHSAQRYDTCGDWLAKDDSISIRVSKTSRSRLDLLLAIHELVEAWECHTSGISTEAVDRFDTAEDWADRGYSEPGDDPAAPYHAQHMVAMRIERLAAETLGVSWNDYSQVIQRLGVGGKPSGSLG